MKRIVLSIFLSSVFSLAFAQDMIISKAGEVIIGYNLEFSESSVYYTVSDDPTSDLKKMLNKDILIIQKKDGTKIDLENVSGRNSQPVSAEMTNSFGLPNEDNEKRIVSFNESYISMRKVDKAQKATMMMVDYAISPESVIETNEISVSWTAPEHLLLRTDKTTLVTKPIDLVLTKSMWDYYDCGPVITPIIKNKTDKVIFIDLGKSYYVSGGASHIFYTSSVTTKTQTNSIAGAIGFIGTASASSSTETKIEQRIISIPPWATMTLEGYYISPQNTIHDLLRQTFSYPYPKDIKDRYIGQYTSLNSESASQFSFGFFITYSYDDSFNKDVAMTKAFFIPHGLLSMGSRVIGDYIDMKGFEAKGNPLFFPAYQHPYTDIWNK